MVTSAAIETHPTVMAVFHAFSNKVLLFICCNLKEDTFLMITYIYIKYKRAYLYFQMPNRAYCSLFGI